MSEKYYAQYKRSHKGLARTTRCTVQRARRHAVGDGGPLCILLLLLLQCYVWREFICKIFSQTLKNGN